MFVWRPAKETSVKGRGIAWAMDVIPLVRETHVQRLTHARETPAQKNACRTAPRRSVVMMAVGGIADLVLSTPLAMLKDNVKPRVFQTVTGRFVETMVAGARVVSVRECRIV